MKKQLSMLFAVMCFSFYPASVRAGGLSVNKATQTKENSTGLLARHNYYAIQQTLSSLEYGGMNFSDDKYYHPMICYSPTQFLRLRVHLAATLEKLLLSSLPVSELNLSFWNRQKKEAAKMDRAILVLLRHQCMGVIRQAKVDLAVGHDEGFYRSKTGVSWIHARVESGVVNFVLDPRIVDSVLLEDELMASFEDDDNALTIGAMYPNIKWQSEQEPVCRAVVSAKINMTDELSMQVMLIFVEVDYSDLPFTVGAKKLKDISPWHLREEYKRRIQEQKGARYTSFNPNI